MTGSDTHTTDVLVIGGGIAGCAAALAAARDGADVTLATKARRPSEASTWWAQGGIAIARGDREQFKQDIMTASDETADPDAVDVLVEDANDVVSDVLVETLSVPFDTAGEDFDFGREAAHAMDRILHIEASTGTHVLERFYAYVEDLPEVTVLDDTAAMDLIARDTAVHGAFIEQDGDVRPIFAGSTVLATGGIGDLYPRSTNPAGSTGDGVAMAALAGAAIEDMEFVQFHPTVHISDGETLLISEAVRGEGAHLLNGDGERFMPEYHPDAELAPRDVVSRAVRAEWQATGEVRLDVSPVDFPTKFPNLREECEAMGVDWAQSIPVEPAQHFLCGGIAVDHEGRSSLDGLYAAGECARTGVHGANRLASTSLLEGLVWGMRAGSDAAGSEPHPIDTPDLDDGDPPLPEGFAEEKFARLREIMGEHVAIERRPEDLSKAVSDLKRLKGEVDTYVRMRTSRPVYELRDACVTALLIANAAADNDESVGTHHLVDQDDRPTGDGTNP